MTAHATAPVGCFAITASAILWAVLLTVGGVL